MAKSKSSKLRSQRNKYGDKPNSWGHLGKRNKQGPRKNWTSDPSLTLAKRAARPSKAALGHVGLNVTSMRFISEGMGKATRRPLTPAQEQARADHSARIDRDFAAAMAKARRLGIIKK